MSRLWILIWKWSHVLEPSPRGVFLVASLGVLVDMYTSPFIFRFFSLTCLVKSGHNFSGGFTLQLMSVIQIWWIATSGSTIFLASLKGMAAGSFWPTCSSAGESAWVQTELSSTAHATASQRATTVFWNTVLNTSILKTEIYCQYFRLVMQVYILSMSDHNIHRDPVWRDYSHLDYGCRFVCQVTSAHTLLLTGQIT